MTVTTFSYTLELNDSGRFTIDTALAKGAKKMSVNTFSTKKIDL